jgi:hypothetical protein
MQNPASIALLNEFTANDTQSSFSTRVRICSTAFAESTVN